ncbi:MAG TPA: Rne/Rng family ribonuclease [Polyangiaceae bacterium]|nr:Rne/Rng family ribonuclease [Polyangiaceae bacterium]
MPRNTLVINCDIRETRVALIEEGIIAELQIERAAARGTVGNIVLGRVTRVLPGMQAAFIDVGMERAAFLHVEDLIRPDDFEAYLSGSRRHEDAERFSKGDGGKRHGQAGAVQGEVEGPDHSHEDDEDDEEDEEDEDVIQTQSGGEADAGPESDGDDDDAVVAEPDPDAGTPEEEEEEEEEGEEDESDDSEEDETVVTGDVDSNWSADADGPLLVVTAAEPGAEPAEHEAGVANPSADGAADEATRRRRRRRRRRGGRDGAEATSAPGAAAPPALVPATPIARSNGVPAARLNGSSQAARPDARNSRDRNDRGGKDRNARGARPGSGNRDRRGSNSASSGGKPTSRVSRSVPITEVVKEGDEVIVQISKEPIGTKGARVTSHVSLPGRYVVYLPTVEHVGVSKRIGSARERARLRDVVEPMKPASGGIIVRTVAEGLTKKSLKADIGYLVKLWEDVSKKKAGAKAPAVLCTELDLVLKTARDLFTDDIESIVIDDKEQYLRLVRFVEMFMPTRVKDIQYYSGDEPIFDAYGIEDEIARALSRKVPLPSGGYLIIDQAEALTAIDVNTGRYVGKGSRDLEETALKTNLEAVEEIAYQLRFRNIGGLVILDLIDMDVSHNREKVWRALEALLAKDKAKTTINRISELGLLEMTRKRTRESLNRTMHEMCFYCDGTGQIQSRTTIAYEILRQIRRERTTLSGYSVVVNAHPAVVDLMQGEEKAAVVEAEKRYMRRIEFNPRREYHIEQFDLQGK